MFKPLSAEEFLKSNFESLETFFSDISEDALFSHIVEGTDPIVKSSSGGEGITLLRLIRKDETDMNVISDIRGIRFLLASNLQATISKTYQYSERAGHVEVTPLAIKLTIEESPFDTMGEGSVFEFSESRLVRVWGDFNIPGAYNIWNTLCPLFAAAEIIDQPDQSIIDFLEQGE